MPRTILLYGATGYSGRLIANEMNLLGVACPGAFRVVLAGRSADRLKRMAAELGMDYCEFGLDDARAMARALGEADAVVNAAGPFAWTAPRLAHGAFVQDCHYVDINGEADVYTGLFLNEDSQRAASRGLAIVCGGGFWAAASNLLLDNALTRLEPTPGYGSELGAIRIAMSRIRTFSRGSAATVWRSLRQQVTVVRKGRTGPPGSKPQMFLWHEPVGKLERVFDFGTAKDAADRRRVSAASLVDTLAARLTALHHRVIVGRIESYVEAGFAARLGYQAGALMSPAVALPLFRALAQQPIGMLAEGPTQAERAREKHVILLEIEDAFRTPILYWRWATPNVYQFTAQLVAVVAAQLATGQYKGWLTPAQVLRALALPLTSRTGPTRGCTLIERSP